MRRTFDFIAALLGLAVVSPLMLLIAVLLRTSVGSPVLFRQLRPGLRGVPFLLLKFRTMRNLVGADGQPLPDAERLTPAGRFLRATSLDELPELWNVLRGEMSLVGPRPLMMEDLPLYTPQQARRHEVRASITGWVQIDAGLQAERIFTCGLSTLAHTDVFDSFRSDGERAGRTAAVIAVPEAR